MQKTFYSSWLGSFLVFKKEIKIWLKILHNAAVKLAACEVTKLCAILLKIQKNLNFGLNTQKNMQQNERIKILCQN